MKITFFLIFITICFNACGNSQSPHRDKQLQLAHQADSVAKPQFKTLEFIVDDKKAFATIDTRYINFKEKKEFPLSLFITVLTNEKDSLGHPTKAENGIFIDIEKDILKTLEKNLISAYIGRTTMNGYRDMIFYIKSSDQQKVTDLLTELQKNHSRIKEYIFEEDETWEAVDGFYKALKSN